MLDKKTLYKIYFSVMQETLEWGENFDGKRYYDYVHGVTDMTDILIRQLEEDNK